MMDIFVVITALFIAFLWGTSPVVHKHVLKNTPASVVMVLSGLSYAMCILIYLMYNKKEITDGFKQISTVNIAWIVITAVITGFIANLIYYHVLKKNDSYVISALIYSCPIFTLILAYFILNEKVSWIGLTGVLLIVTGVICLAMNEKTSKIEEFGDFKTM